MSAEFAKAKCIIDESLFQILPALQTKPDTFTNIVDPDETARNEPSNQDLHCSPFWFWFLY